MHPHPSSIIAGFSRHFIESKLSSSGHSVESIEQFWTAVSFKALDQACSNLQHSSPTLLWQSLRSFQYHVSLSPRNLVLAPPPVEVRAEEPPTRRRRLRFVCISDTHGLHDQMLHPLPPGDVLIHCGDFTDLGSTREMQEFDHYIGRQAHPVKLVIAGNHERELDQGFIKRRHLLSNALYLEDSGVTLAGGCLVYGSPYQPAFGCQWAFNRPNDILAQKWADIPTRVDVLMTHTPPLGRGDSIVTGEHVGDVQLLRGRII